MEQKTIDTDRLLLTLETARKELLKHDYMEGTGVILMLDNQINILKV